MFEERRDFGFVDGEREVDSEALCRAVLVAEVDGSLDLQELHLYAS